MKARLWKIVRTYPRSITFWCGFALLVGLQYRPLDRQHFWAWLPGIEISATAGDGLLVIQIRNSVAGKTSNGTGVGLRNAEARLKYLYSGDASLRLTMAKDHNAVVRLSLPALNSQVSENPNAYSVPQKEDPQCVFSSSMTSR